jgi:hypothetical protein
VHKDNWKDFKLVLSEKKMKIYQRNKSNIKPIDAINNKDMEEFIEIVFKSYINQLRQNKEWIDDNDKKLHIKYSSKDMSNIVYDSTDKKIIIEKIKSGISYPKYKKNIDFHLLKFPITNINKYQSYSFEEMAYTWYLLNKYPEVKLPCFPSDKKKDHDAIMKNIIAMINPLNSTNANGINNHIKYFESHLIVSKNLIPYLIIWKDDKSHIISPYLIDGTKEILKKFPNTKLIYYKLSIVIDENIAHANGLLYDVKNKYIERFDPYGNVPYASESMDIYLRKFFKKNLGIKYYSPKHTAKGITFQVIGDETNIDNRVKGDPGGYCLAWTLWYIEMRLLHPNLNPKKLIKLSVDSLNKLPIKFIDYIRNYANYLDSQKNKLLKKAGIPKIDWYRDYLSDDYYEKYIKTLRKEIKILL